MYVSFNYTRLVQLLASNQKSGVIYFKARSDCCVLASGLLSCKYFISSLIHVPNSYTCILLYYEFYRLRSNVTLHRYIPPENVPVQYGGLGKLEDLQNAPVKPTSEFTVRGGEKVNLEIDGIEVLFR